MSCNFCGVASGNVETLIDTFSKLFHNGSSFKQRRRKTTQCESSTTSHSIAIGSSERSNGRYDGVEGEEKEGEELMYRDVENDWKIPRGSSTANAKGTKFADAKLNEENLKTESSLNASTNPLTNSLGEFHIHPDIEKDESDTYSIPSLFSSSIEDDEVILANVTAKECNKTIGTKRDEKATNSVMAWGMLVAVLSSPAPSALLQNVSNNKRTTKREIVNLWDDDA